MDVERKKDYINGNDLKERMAEWFKAADCKSVEVSHRRFESCFFQKSNSRHSVAR